ncbi:hypothetical protein BD410DRAFT_603991 [Rickenella mellea]|uniref:Vacuolar protein sorting-associated protein 51 homolog n=1 Tax=Rickenella mellea TaxID=50990 RepID=A0A4Y7QDB1_9AGAM|nr:hypothetical protein BD410DRAFT_603991 [Rickenella mellea]
MSSTPRRTPSNPSHSNAVARPPLSSPSSSSTLSAAAALSPRRATTPTPVVNPPHAPSTPPPIEKPKGRARDLLRKHYGLGVGPPPPLQGPGRPLDPMNMDSPAFDARSYYEQLISTSSLLTLLKRENELTSEIRQLDSERQSLVYNHHHELIAASDTISTIKTRAESLDVDLEKLREAFSEISRLGAEITLESEPTPSVMESNQNADR